jgi:hypothetical protein
MSLHQNKSHATLDLNALFLLLNKINILLTTPTLEALTIQRNATMQVIREILAITQPEEAQKFEIVFFRLNTIFPEKEYCRYSTGPTLKKNIHLNKELFHLGCSLCHHFSSDKTLKTHNSLLGYLSLHLNDGYKQKPCTQQQELAREEMRTYKKYSAILPPSILELAQRFTEKRARFYALSVKPNILAPSSY